MVKNDEVMDLIVVFCILFVFMLVLYCFCVATEFSVNKDLYYTRTDKPLSVRVCEITMLTGSGRMYRTGESITCVA